MKILNFFNSSKKDKQIEDLEDEIYSLKRELRREVFKTENFDVIKKYTPGFHIGPDLIVSELKVKDNYLEVAIDTAKSFAFNFFGLLNNKEPMKKVTFYLVFECIDLKSKEKVSFNLEEVKKLENI